MDLCRWLQPGRHTHTPWRQISSCINLITPTLFFFFYRESKEDAEGCTCFFFVFFFLWGWCLHCSPACQEAGPDRFTCVTEWGWGVGAGGVCSCWVTWWQVSRSMTHQEDSQIWVEPLSINPPSHTHTHPYTHLECLEAINSPQSIILQHKPA